MPREAAGQLLDQRRGTGHAGAEGSQDLARPFASALTGRGEAADVARGGGLRGATFLIVTSAAAVFFGAVRFATAFVATAFRATIFLAATLRGMSLQQSERGLKARVVAAAHIGRTLG